MSRNAIWMFVEVESGNSHTDIFGIIGSKKPSWASNNLSTFNSSFILWQIMVPFPRGNGDGNDDEDEDDKDDDDDDNDNDDDNDDDDGHGSK